MADSLDKFPTIAPCMGCGNHLKYAPLRVPKGPPVPNVNKVGHYGIAYIDMCTNCVRAQLDTLDEKILRGEMYPREVWEATGDPENPEFQIVPLDYTIQKPARLTEEEDDTQPPPPPPEESVGLVRRTIRAIWRFIY
jgi:hypothetical protein